MKRQGAENRKGNETGVTIDTASGSHHPDLNLPWSEIMKMSPKQLADHFGIKGESGGLKDDLRMLSDIAEKLSSMKPSDRRNALNFQFEYIKEDYGKYHIKLNKFLEKMIEKWLKAADVETGMKKATANFDDHKADIISNQDEETLLEDIVPMLKKRFGNLYNINSLNGHDLPDINLLIHLVLEKAPKLLSMHGLSHLKDSKKVKNFLVKKILDIE
jgi:hypothetical protein